MSSLVLLGMSPANCAVFESKLLPKSQKFNQVLNFTSSLNGWSKFLTRIFNFPPTGKDINNMVRKGRSVRDKGTEL